MVKSVTDTLRNICAKDEVKLIVFGNIVTFSVKGKKAKKAKNIFFSPKIINLVMTTL